MSGNSWMSTFTGLQFDPMKPDPFKVRIEDIAHSLATKNRWVGQAAKPISIAEHSVRTQCLLEAEGRNLVTQFRGLMHDCGEAYLPDVAKPYKHLVYLLDPYRERMVSFKEQERIIQVAILKGLALHTDLRCEDDRDLTSDSAVEHADLVMLVTEARDLTTAGLAGLNPCGAKLPEPLKVPIQPWCWEDAEKEFLLAFDHLRNALFTIPLSERLS